MESIHRYIQSVTKQFKTGIARELAYRGYLESLLEALAPGLVATSDPARIECGAPDYIVTKNGVPIGYIEAKDIGKPLASSEYKEQFDRYKGALGNLIITDYLEFSLYRDGELSFSASIAKFQDGKITPITENFADLKNLIQEFTSYSGQTITSASKLSKMMADKARLLAKIIESALTNDEETEENTTLREQMEAFRTILLHEIDPKGFADIYAQTIAYGMFAARLHDKTLEDFSRQEAAELIPKSNPFLRNLFGYIAGPNLDNRILWIVEALVEVFRATNVAKLLESFGRSTQRRDPVIHFYETFLAEYDPALRKSRGVWYTPEPVVHFIVRSVDEVLKAEFGIADGIADTSRIVIQRDSQVRDRRSKSGYRPMDVEIHRVQILDPAVGTGTFLADVTKTIFERFADRRGAWPAYVKEHLVPRLNGFEILMASYAMAHLKMDLLLRETGHDERDSQRFRIFLTNTLEEFHPDTGTLFAGWLSREANEANHVKRETPVMVVLGNPPYSGISSNMGEWISNLIEDYKHVDGKHFGERKHWLHDDYVKFIRYGQYLVERNGEGIVAYINNHSFIDNPTFRGMRWNLLHAFDEILVVDLNGSSKKHSLAPEDVEDENVFDIQQGVSINLFIKTGKKKDGQLGKVRHYSVWGSRPDKYEWLWNSSISGIPWSNIEPTAPYFFFSPSRGTDAKEYFYGFSVEDVFKSYTMGFASAKDALTVSFTQQEIWDTVTSFRDLSIEELRAKYRLKKDSRDWSVATAKNDITQNYGREYVRKTSYRPFDDRFTYYTGNSRGFYASPQRKVMSHLGRDGNVAFCTCRMNRDFSHTYWVAKDIVSKSVISSLDNAYVFPLYLYPEADGSSPERLPNIKDDFIRKLETVTSLRFNPAFGDQAGSFGPFDILDYIYAVLHDARYLSAHQEQLKSDFPRVPYPSGAEAFWEWAVIGAQLRAVHTMHGSTGDINTRYPRSGSNFVERVAYENGKVWINADQCFEGVPPEIWSMQLGGYAPAEKWLKDRKGRKLTYDDIAHYQKIVAWLDATFKLTGELAGLPLPHESPVLVSE